jgi:hypothetical protein
MEKKKIIPIATNYEQGKILEELIGTDSADMVYIDYGYATRLLPKNDIDANSYPVICCAWSLPALLDILPEIQGTSPVVHTHDNSISYAGKDGLTVVSDSLISASYEIILKLHKLNYVG